MNRKPNLLFIMVDQLRYDMVGCSGKYPVRTPHLDRLAAEGAWFSNAYTHIPLCCPARQSFLCGRRPETFGALWNYDLGPKIPALEPSAYSWPRTLGELGYRSAYIGKWHVHPTSDPTAFGYDSYVSTAQYSAFRALKYPVPEHRQSDDEAFRDSFGSVDRVALEHTRTHWMAERAIETIERLSANAAPWHVRLDLVEPHLPCDPHPDFNALYDPADIPPWGSFSDTFENKPYIQKQQLVNWRVERYDWEDWAPIVARYYAIITQLDDAIGRVLQALERLGLANDTIVVFTTDHGDMCGGHRMMDKHYVLYEDVVKVPLIVRWPGRVKAGTTIGEFVYNLLDVPPTLIELAGAAPPDRMQGRSLRPLLAGESVPDWRREIVATYNGQQFGLYTQRMLRTGDWKYVWNTTDVDELYDLNGDPHELRNRIHDTNLRDLVRDFRKRLYEVLLSEGDTLTDNRWMRNQLLHNRKL